MLPDNANTSSYSRVSANLLPTNESSLNERRYRALFDHTNDAVFIIGMSGIHREVNQRACEMFGFTTAELLEMSVHDLVAPDEVPQSQDVREQLLQGVVMPIYERRFQRKDGSILIAEVNVALIRDQAGAPLYIQSILRDVTQRKQLEIERLEQERLRLELETERELNATKAELMVTIAHELRTPLALILLQRDVLDRYHAQLTDAQRHERLGIIRKQVYRLTVMLEDLSFLVKGTVNALELRPQVENVEVFVNAFILDFRQVVGLNRLIKTMFTGDLAQVNMECTFARRILTHLLLNAVKYSPEAATTRLDVTRVGDALQFVVRDQGIGILAEEQGHVFELFFRGSNAKGERGMGIGLSVVAQAVELYGGRIEVESQLDKGSTFTVTLPILGRTQNRDEDHLGSAVHRG